MTQKLRIAALGAAWLWASTGCDDPDSVSPPTSALPTFIVPGSESQHAYLGTDEDDRPDLLTSGLGTAGLAGPAPGYADPNSPTPLELRTHTLYNNYRGLVDITRGGGYGRLYGPNVTLDGVATSCPGKIPGTEYLAFADDGSHSHRVGLLVQIPSTFDPQRPCLIAAPSSGSRGIYGAIGTAGQWGLKRGCAVAYTDKGSGTGYHDLETNTGYDLKGQALDLGTRAAEATFQAVLTEEQRRAYTAAFPGRIATKHAHSGQNPQASWGQHVLQSLQYAFHVLNRHFHAPRADGSIPATFTPDNTLVIATSLSNGAGASLRAAEADTAGLIDGVVAGEPNIQPPVHGDLRIRQGAGVALQTHSRSLLDVASLVNLYQPCASRAAQWAQVPLNSVKPEAAEARCQSLLELGLLGGLAPSSTVEERAQVAQRFIHDAGILEDQDALQPAHYALLVPQGILATYSNQFGRFGVTDNLCGYSFASTDATTGRPVPTPASRLVTLTAVSNGQPANAGIHLVYNLGANGPIVDNAANLVVSHITGRQDLNIDGALCWRALATGVNPLDGVPLTAREATLGRYTVTRAMHEAVQAGLSQTVATGDLRGKPALIVTGRSDGFLPVNHASRPYYALNQKLEGPASRLRYYEVKHAHHLDTLNGTRGFDTRYVPLIPYYQQALDLMFEHLTRGGALPPSQVLRTTPRALDSQTGAAVDLSREAHLPPIAAQPSAGEAISFENGLLSLPE